MNSSFPHKICQETREIQRPDGNAVPQITAILIDKTGEGLKSDLGALQNDTGFQSQRCW